jgi:outer membrane lipoprotein SlyB
MKSRYLQIAGSLLFGTILSCSEPLTTREKGAAIGTVGGAAVGGIVGSAVGHSGAGAAVGAGLGLGTGALIGDRVQALERKQSDLDEQIKQNEIELRRQREELEKLRKETKER